MGRYYLNGVRCGGERSVAPQYGGGKQQFRRMIWNWLTKIVGWTHIDDESGDPTQAWDTAEIGGTAGIADGVTDGSDPEKFTSTIGGFNALIGKTRVYLLVKGFSDPERNGFYEVDRVISDNEIKIRKEFSLHTDGLPLGENTLTWWVFDFWSWATRPGKIGNTTWWVLEGTGVGGTFHLRCQNNTTVSYMSDKYDLSPYPDWLPGTNAWNTPARHTTVQGNQTDPYTDLQIAWGVAEDDKSTAFFWCRSYQYDQVTGSVYPSMFYFGDIVPFRPTSDLRPVVCLARVTDNNWHYDAYDNVGMIAGDDTAIEARTLYASQTADTALSCLDHNRKISSYHSGRKFRLPWIICSDDSGHEEVRGYYKDLLMMTHNYNDRACTPFGSSRDMLYLGGDIATRFNGSRQYRYIF